MADEELTTGQRAVGAAIVFVGCLALGWFLASYVG